MCNVFEFKIKKYNEDGMSHLPISVQAILNFVPDQQNGNYLDVTGGGGGHVEAFLNLKNHWNVEVWDTDPEAVQRLRLKFSDLISKRQVGVLHRNFRIGPDQKDLMFDFILADLGVSSFQLDDKSRGLSLFSETPVDFRLNPMEGPSFLEWLNAQSESQLCEILERFGDEPKAKRAAKFLKESPVEIFSSAKKLAERIGEVLQYGAPSRIHPATRIFQALRIAVNDEWGALDSLLSWAPKQLKVGGCLAMLTFHSIEDGRVKNAFRDLAAGHSFDILTKKPLVPSDKEILENPRSRSAKLRVLRRAS